MSTDVMASRADASNKGVRLPPLPLVVGIGRLFIVITIAFLLSSIAYIGLVSLPVYSSTHRGLIVQRNETSIVAPVSGILFDTIGKNGGEVLRGQRVLSIKTPMGLRESPNVHWVSATLQGRLVDLKFTQGDKVVAGQILGSIVDGETSQRIISYVGADERPAIIIGAPAVVTISIPASQRKVRIKGRVQNVSTLPVAPDQAIPALAMDDSVYEVVVGTENISSAEITSDTSDIALLKHCEVKISLGRRPLFDFIFSRFQ